jgi:hypothetical protein
MVCEQCSEKEAKAKLLEYHFPVQEFPFMKPDVIRGFFSQNQSLISVIRNKHVWNEKLDKLMMQQKFEQVIRNFKDVEDLTGKRITLGSSRALILPLQSDDLSSLYVKMYKEEMREKDQALEVEKNNRRQLKEKEIKNIIASMGEDNFYRRFIKILADEYEGGSGLNNVRFLDYFGYLLDSANEEEMSMLRDEYSDKVKEIRNEQQKEHIDNAERLRKLIQLNEQERVLSHRINTETFGREHFFREIGLIYQFGSDQR